MQKEELKSLAKEMYNNLLNHIDEQEDATIEQFVNHLRDAISVIAQVDNDDIDSLKHAKSTFHNAYKDIAQEALLSYESTNDKFEELSIMQNVTLEEYSKEQISVPDITKKFNKIQKHMTKEFKKANEIISQLTTQVKTLEQKTSIDSLTKVFNRRALDSYLNSICSKVDILYDLHILMLDIDDFKILNDEYGHLAGDKVLIFISNILKKTLRDGDKIFRYGGEEFIIVLNRIDNELCMNIANRLLELVRHNNLIYKGESIHVTLSIGETKHLKGDSSDSLIDRADQALYLAKKAGKDQIVSKRD